MTNIFTAIVGGLLLTISAAGIAAAESPCVPGVFNQSDMIGRYIGQDAPITLEVETCGGTTLRWLDELGRSQWASYSATERLEGGGYMATVGSPFFPGMTGPWFTRTLMYKPAEPGVVQLVLYVAPSADLYVFRARKAP